MRKKRHLAALTVALLSMLASASCGSTQHPSSEPTEGQADETISDSHWQAAYRTRGMYIGERSNEGREAVKNRLVTITVVKSDSGREKRLYPGVELRSGDRFHFWVEAEEPLYLAAFYLAVPEGAGEETSDVTVLELLDGSTSIEVEEGSRIRYPPEGDIVLDDQAGEEHLYIVASRLPIDDLADDTAAAIETARTEKQLPPAPSPRPRARHAHGSGGGAKAPVKRHEQGTGDVAAASPQPTKGCGAGGLRSEFDLGCGAPTRSMRPDFVQRVRTRGMSVEADDSSIHASPDDEGVAVILFPIQHLP